MPETKHTPGPWYVAVSDKNGYWIDTDDELIAKVPRSGDVEYANAQLIAAAPEMLEALQGLMPVVNRIMHLSGETWNLDDEEAVQEARAVIAKAISAK